MSTCSDEDFLESANKYTLVLNKNIEQSSSINCKYRIGDIVRVKYSNRFNYYIHSFVVTHIRIEIGDGRIIKQYSHERELWYSEEEITYY